MYAVEESVEESNKPLRAPLMRPVALPSTEETGDTESEELLCSGPDIGWYTTVDLLIMHKVILHISHNAWIWVGTILGTQ
jgi:hypothetical protein